MNLKNNQSKVLKSILFTGIIGVFLFFACQSPEKENSNPQKIKPNPHLQSFIKKMGQCLTDSLKKYPAPGLAMCIVKDSTVVYLKCYGERNFGSGDSINPHSVFRLASVSKPFAATLAACYAKDSLLSWNDQIIKHLPYFKLSSPYQTNDIQIQHILSHTTGIPYHALTNYIEYGENLDTMLRMLSDSLLDSICPVGTIYSYQNVAYSIIERVLNEVTGNAYEEMMEYKLFCPLNMADASVTFDGLFADSNVAYPHRFYNGSWVPVKIKPTYYNAKPAGGVNASINDMAQFLILLLGNRPDVVHPEILEELYQPKIHTPIKYKYFRTWDSLQALHYGMGFRILHTTYDTIVYHGGYANSYRSELAFSPGNKIGICVLVNAPALISNICTPSFFDFYKHYADSVKQFEQKNKAIFLPGEF